MSKYDGMYKCAFCGEEFYVTNPGEYVYKRPPTTKGGSGMIFFCGWDHLRAWEKKKEQEKQKRRYNKMCKRAR